MMRYLAVLLLVLPLAGCLPEQKRQLAACEVEARQAYASGETSEETIADIGTSIRSCMAARGYTYHSTATKCRDIDANIEGSPHCYIADSWVGRTRYRLEKGIGTFFGPN